MKLIKGEKGQEKNQIYEDISSGEKFDIGILNQSKEFQKSIITIDKYSKILSIKINPGIEIKIKFQDIIWFGAQEEISEDLKSKKVLEENKKRNIFLIIFRFKNFQFELFSANKKTRMLIHWNFLL